MNYAQINWIASYPKSGNTWVRLLFDAYLMGEIDINEILCTVQDDPSNIFQPSTGDDIAQMPIDIQQLARPMAMLRLVLAYNKEKTDVPFLVKTHSPHVLVNGIELIPHALTRSVVYIVRDPRDVLLSFSKHMGESVDQAIESLTDRFRTLKSQEFRVADFLGNWAEHVRSYANADTHNVRVFRYEDLRENTAETFAEIVKHVGLEVKMNRIKKAVEITELSKLRDKEKQAGFTESSPHAKDQFFGKGKVGGWREKLTPKQIYTIEKRFGTVMKRYGYLEKRRAA